MTPISFRKFIYYDVQGVDIHYPLTHLLEEPISKAHIVPVPSMIRNAHYDNSRLISSLENLVTPS